MASFLPRERKKTDIRGQKGSGDICGTNAERGPGRRLARSSLPGRSEKDARFSASSAYNDPSRVRTHAYYNCLWPISPSPFNCPWSSMLTTKWPARVASTATGRALLTFYCRLYRWFTRPDTFDSLQVPGRAFPFSPFPCFTQRNRSVYCTHVLQYAVPLSLEWIEYTLGVCIL